MLIASAVYAAIELDEGVLVLNDANFDEAVAQNDVLLVEFYAPWCGHCKSLAPEYVKAAASLASTPAKLAKLDATANKESSEKHGIRGFPTLKFFKNGKVSEYNGGRTAPDIVQWMNKKSGPAAAAVTDVAGVEALKEANDAFVLGVFDAADSANAKAFMAMAGDDENLVYAYTTDAAVRSSLAVAAGDHVIVLKAFDEKRNDHALTGDFDTSAVSTFVAGASTPLVQTFSQESAKKIFASPVKNHMLFFTDAGADHHAPTMATFTTLATEFRGKALFVNVPHTEQRVLDFFGITADDLPTLMLAEMAEDAMKKYPYKEELTAAGVRTFLGDFFGGKLSPHLKSEDPEPSDTTGDVTVLRGSTFADIVLNNDKDALVEFYAPWCGHCKSLAPIWDQLGEKMKGNDHIVIAKMNAESNEHEAVEVSGFPTIKFYKAGNKTPQDYNGERTLDGFTSFLKENASKPLKDEL
jgi:protein disulfide-isomerase A1